jgi:hypothetical protein
VTDAAKRRLEQALAAQVHTGERYVAFGELTLAEVRGQAAKLGDVGSWGPLARVAKVARAWNDLAGAMEGAGAGRVRDLDEDAVVTWAERAWVIPPAEGMI